MIQKVVNYKVKADAVQATQKVLREFIEGIRNNEPQTNYTTYQLVEDQTRFMHVASFPNEDAEKKHHSAEYTQKFLQELASLCESQPTASTIATVADSQGDGVVDWAN